MAEQGSGEGGPLYTALVQLKPEGMTLGGWATKAGLARNVFNYIRRHDNPKRETLDALLDAAGASHAALEAALNPTGPAVADPRSAFRSERPRDVPVRGTPSCGDLEVNGEHVETIEMDLGEIVDYVRRPLALEGRRDVYAIYFTGYSMQPRFEPGEVAYVDTKRPPLIGDYVVVQLRGRPDENGEARIVSALVKRLVRRTQDWIELEQFNQPLVFRIEQRRVAALHRIIPLAELVAV